MKLRPRWTPSRFAVLIAVTITVGTAACTETTSTAPMPRSSASFSSQPWGPETPHFNDELILRPVGGGGAQGHVKFRQPNDDQLRINLDVVVRGLAPNTHYQLQRAVDTNDGNCTSTAWLTLGKGAVPQDIVTDENGNGSESLFRVLATPIGTRFDIHMQIVVAGTSTAVLTTGCYEFTVSR
jgi:hypothetical protein